MPNDSIRDAAARSREVLPDKFIARLERDFEMREIERILSAIALPGPKGVRFNTLKAEPAETRLRLESDGIPLKSVPWCLHASIVDRKDLPALLKHSLWEDGAVHVQSLPSIAVGLAVNPQPGERILDLCGAPGGKSAHLAALMENDGEIVANDLSRTRCHRMRALLKKLGAKAAVRVSDGTKIGHREPMTFDRVLVDAPCSGEGRFTIEDSSTIDGWTVAKSRRLASLQKALLHSAIHAVKPGGVIIYSTCTYSREENEAVLERALDRYGDGPYGVELQKMETDLPGVDGAIFKSIPDPEGDFVQQAMEGFFVARLRRRSS